MCCIGTDDTLITSAPLRLCVGATVVSCCARESETDVSRAWVVHVLATVDPDHRVEIDTPVRLIVHVFFVARKVNRACCKAYSDPTMIDPRPRAADRVAVHGGRARGRSTTNAHAKEKQKGPSVESQKKGPVRPWAYASFDFDRGTTYNMRCTCTADRAAWLRDARCHGFKSQRLEHAVITSACPRRRPVSPCTRPYEYIGRLNQWRHAPFHPAMHACMHNLLFLTVPPAVPTHCCCTYSVLDSTRSETANLEHSDDGRSRIHGCSI